MLPSVASLKALRVFARKDAGHKADDGFGDPIFNPAEARRWQPSRPGPPARSLRPAPTRISGRAPASIARGSRTRLPQLPDTADELNAIAKNLGVAAADIHLGEDASETTLKRTPLADYGIVYFATHGLVAGDVKGLAEPSLVLSIPKTADRSSTTACSPRAKSRS